MSKVDWRLPEFDYILETFPNQSTETNRMIYHKFLWPNESLWLGPVPKDCLSIHSDDVIIKTMVNYFKKQLWNHTYDKNSSDKENTESKDFVKLVWLTGEYFSQGFETYFSAHYNPRSGVQAIHPGGGRQVIYKLFDKSDTITMFYFNTGGTEWPWLNNCQRISYDQLIKLGYQINFVADHGSFIPHVFWSDLYRKVTTTLDGVIQAEPCVRNRLRQLRIKSNIKLAYYFDPFVDNKNPNVILNFKNFNAINIVKAILLILNNLLTDDDNEFTIEYVQ